MGTVLMSIIFDILWQKLINAYRLFMKLRYLERVNIKLWTLFAIVKHSLDMIQIQGIACMDLMLIW